MTDQPPPARPLLEILQDRLAKGREIVTRPECPPGLVKMWTGSVRTAIRGTFGPDSPQDRAWPAPNEQIVPERAREVFTERLTTLQRLVSHMADGSVRAMVGSRGGRVFLGHGRSPIWRELQEFLERRLQLHCDEFNRESVAGVATTERIGEMLEGATFAFLVMTAENQHADATMHARENVVHETGLFQGKLGMRRAIMLVEEGCATFSNVHGLTYIGFPPGRISACFEDIRRVLEREGVIAA